LTALCAVLVLGELGCTRGEREEPLVVFAAGSLARPLGAALDSFRVATGIESVLVPAGSLELARRVTELGQTPDVIALADEEVFAKLLIPSHVSWYARFAGNRMVLARRSALPSVGENWRAALTRPGVQTGRSDPDLDPGGYRALMVFKLAERHYRDDGLAARLLAASPKRNVRPKSAELIALLQTGELDYAWMYESSARGASLPFDTLPSAVDLGSTEFGSTYREVRVMVQGKNARDTIEIVGAPIQYGITIPREAKQPDAALDFLRYLYSADGQRVLRSQFLFGTEPAVVGEAAPALTTAAAR
jgi:molybdate/tungstate transport system substrate-binding protein